MSDVIQLDGIAFIPLDVAAHEADLSSDYLYRLSRNGTIASRIIGRRRYVEKQSLQAFLIDRAHRLEGQRVELAKQRAEEYARRSGAVPSEGIRTSAQSAETRAAFPGRSGVSGDALRETTQGVAAAALEVTKRAIESTRVVASGTSKKGSVVSNVLNQHGAKLVEGMRESMSVSGMGDAALRAGISGVHVPLYSVTPMMEFVHKLIALTLAFMLTFGTYSLVDPQYAKFALTSIESNVHAVHMSYVSFTHGGVTKLASSADAQLAAAAENPAQTLALATYTITNAVPQSLATLAKSINSSVNGFVYAIAFPDALVRSPVTGTVDVHVTTYQHTTVASTGSNAGAGVGGGIGTSTGTSTANSVGVGQGGPVTVIQNPVIERIIETAAPSMVAAAGGITEDELNARLQQLDNKLSSQIFAITAQGSANTTAISSNYQSIATTQRIDQLARVDISSSHWTGGTIDGADISNVTSLSVSGNTALATTSVTGDLTLSGSLRFTTSSSTINATTASTTNLLFTNATGTYAVIQDATTTGHAIFSGEARISDAAATSTGNLYFGNNTAHINYNSSDYTVYGGSFYTNAGRIVSIGNNETIGLGVRNVNGDGTYYLGASHSFTPDLIFTNTGLTETARLTNGGFFGIGTTTPWAQLSLSSASGSPAFAIGSSTTQFIVDSVGNVGIGKSNPQTALDVVGNSYFRNAVGAVGSNDGVEIGTDSSAPRVSLVQGGRYVGLYSADAPGNTYLKNVAGGDLLLYGGSGGNQELARLTNSGFFGIGTSSPFVALAVQGSGYFTSGLTAATGTFTSATTTNFFSTNASTTNATSTNLYATNGSFGSLSVGASNSSGLATFGNGFLSLASSTIGNGTQAGGLTISGGATTTGDSYVAGNLLVAGNTTTLGTSTSNLLVVNSAINSNLIPNGNKIFDLGSPSYYWRNGYIDTITVNNISAASTSIGGTASNTFTLNSDNATADTEDMSLIFFRGTVVPNALLSWNSAAGAKRFEFNQPLYISNQSGSTTQTTLTLKAVAGQTGNMLDIQNSSGSSLFSIGATGATTVGGSLTVNGSLTTTQQASTTLFSSLGPAYFGRTATTTIDGAGNVNVAGNLLVNGTTNLTGLLSLANASTSLLSVFQKAYFGGTATTTIDSAGNISLPSGAQILAADGTGSLPGIAFANNPASGISNSAGSLSLSTDGFNRLTVTTGGVVGIGTTTPSANLEIASSLNGFTSNLLYLTNQGGATSTASRMTFRTLDQTGAATSTGAITSILNQNYGAGKGDLVLSTLQNGTLAEAMRVTSAGYVGIGTTTPSTNLSVQGNGLFSGNLSLANLTATGTITTANLTSTGLLSLANASTSLLSVFQRAYFGGTATSTFASDGSLNVASAFTAYASSTIGDGTQTGGLTISGGATTTGAHYIGGGLTVNSSSNSSFLGTGDVYFGNGTMLQSLGGAPDLAIEGYVNINGGLNTGADTRIGGNSATLWTALGGSADLAVAGWINANSGVITAQGSASSPGYNFNSSNNSGIFATGANSSAGLGFSVKGAEAGRFDTTGFFGIGTTTPSTNLSVQGNGLFSGNLSLANLTATGTITTANLTSTGLLSLANASTSLLSVFQRAYFGGTATTTIDNAGNIAGAGILTLAGTSGTSTISSGQGFTVGGSQFVVQQGSGNVGVGTATPQAALDLGSTNRYFAWGTSYKFGVDSTNVVAFDQGSSYPSGYRLNTAAAAGLFINSSGNVGIGTTTPAALFSVAGAGYFTGGLGIGTTANLAANDITFATASGIAGLGTSGLDGSAITDQLRIRGDAGILFSVGGTKEIVMNTSGNFGIGTTTPGTSGLGEKLTTFGNGIVNNDGNSVFSMFGSFGAGKVLVGSYSNSVLSLRTNNADRLTVDTSGNVGIGTTSPFAKLAVTGAVSGTSFQVANSSNAPQFSVLSNGTVGIGTTTSSSATALTGLLNIQAVDTGTNPFSIFSETGASIFQFENSSGGRLYVKNTTGSTGVQLSGSTGGISYFNTGNVGIGTTTPFRKLSVTDTVSAAQVAIAYDGTRYTQEQTDASGDFHINASGQDTLLDDSNMWVCSGGACPTGNPTGTGNLIVENKVGVGTSSPGYMLDVLSSTNASQAHFGNVADGGAYILSANATQGLVSTGAAYNGTNWVAKSTTATIFGGSSGLLTFYSDSALTAGNTYTPTERMRIDTSGNVGIGTTSPSKQLSVQSTMYVGANGATGLGTATSTFQGDIKITGKLDVSTIDPPYTIDGTKYATYAASMTGVKEETAQTIELTQKDASGKYAYTINFDNQEKGSDLWLFYQVTDFGAQWQYLTVLLTPSFDGAVFYKKVPGEHKLIVYANQPGEVSMRLTGNRYDFTKWGNVRPDQDGNTEGTHVITSKPTIEQTAAAAVTQ